jgi:hypothetical protein
LSAALCFSTRTPQAIIDKDKQYGKSVRLPPSSKRSSQKDARHQRREINTININPSYLVTTTMSDTVPRLLALTVTVNYFDLEALQLTLFERDGNCAVHLRDYNTTAHWK